MSGNVFGKFFRVMTFGESHGAAVGCVIDGCPAGVPLDRERLARELRRRRPGGGGAASSPRGEADDPEILSGVFEGKTLGTPIAVVIRNQDQRSGDYDALRDVYRPGHGDWTWEARFGRRDHRGGGRASARETAGRVAAGAAAKALLAALYPGLRILAWTSAACGLVFPAWGEEGFNIEEIERNPLRVPSAAWAERAAEALEALRLAGDSAGGTVSCRVTGLPAGLGDPVFGKLSARLAQGVMSIGACKGIEFGAGFAAAGMRGSEHNDAFLPAGGAAGEGAWGDGPPPAAFKTNRAGGVLGGISTGAALEFQAAFKPTASIALPQETVDRGGARRELRVQGRHDVCVVPRAVPVVEAMTALVLADLALSLRSARV